MFKRINESFKEKINKPLLIILSCLYFVLLVWSIIFHMSGYAGLHNTYNLLIDNVTIVKRFEIAFTGAFYVYGPLFYVDMLANIILFLPFGMIVLFKKENEKYNFLKGLLLASISSIAFEIIEGLTRIGNVDLLDFLMNVMGFIIGYFIIKYLKKRLSSYSLNIIILVLVIIFVPILIFAIISLPLNWYKFAPIFDFKKYPYLWK